MKLADCIFCDDIRVEETGKSIYVGIYGSVMFVPEIPFQLPRLNIVTKLIRLPTENIKIKAIKINVPGQDEPILIPQEHAYSDMRAINAPNDGEPYRVRASSIITLRNVDVTKEGRITVYIETEDESIYAGSVNVRLASTQVAPANMEALTIGVLLYRKIVQANARDSSQIANTLLEVMSSYVAPDVENKLKMHSAYQFETGKNKFTVVSLEKLDTEGKINISDIPSEAKYKVSFNDNHSFNVTFDSPHKIEKFEWEITKKQKKKS